jgi:WD repeat-containing protein 23
MYDLEKRKRIIKIAAHDEDVNTVAFAEQDSSHIFYSGSDDSLCKVWDRRTFHSDTHTTPVGVLEGHMDGITCITSKGDGRYFISNGKDQTMKLWDIRKMKSSDNANATQTHSRNRMGWDYRYQNYRFVHRMHPADMSIMTYVGHRVLSTLIRCYFSPPMSTGQRFVYSGSYDGSIYVYDLLTGEIVRKLTGHGGVVRDVSWHPYLPMMLSSSWDNSVVHWTWRSQHAKTANTKDEDAMQDDDDEQQWEDIDEDDSDYQPLSDDE